MLSKLFILFKGGAKSHQHHIFLAACIILISVISYNLGQINSLKKTPIIIKEGNALNADIYQATKPVDQNIQNTKHKIPDTKLDPRVVVSKNSDKYHYSWCSGAQRIKSENQIWFNSAQEAEAKGYVLAGNCK